MTDSRDIDIAPHIRTIRAVRVLLDSDLAALYGVPTKRLNEAVKRNRKLREPTVQTMGTQRVLVHAAAIKPSYGSRPPSPA